MLLSKYGAAIFGLVERESGSDECVLQNVLFAEPTECNNNNNKHGDK